MDINQKASDLVKKMTLEEKAKLICGRDMWCFEGVKSLGLQELVTSDGPHGIRKQFRSDSNTGFGDAYEAICYPTASLSACSFDPELLKEMGISLGLECHDKGVDILLGPGVNHKRSPLCGRNFEYFSEDPFLSGNLAAGFINGVQSQMIGVSLKHFAANNQEKARLINNSIVDLRALREIYLKAFEIAIKKAHPWTIMSSYNQINGVYSSENPFLLEEIGRKEFGFDGIYISDWGALSDPVVSFQKGLDIEMPGISKGASERVIKSIKKGEFEEAKLDEIARRIVATILKSKEGSHHDYHFNLEESLNVAKKVALESMVLVKNEDQLLPLNKYSNIALIGQFAKTPRYQGSGSSRINPVKLTNLYEVFKDKGIRFDYADGYDLTNYETNEKQIKEAIKTAKNRVAVVVVIGLPDSFESEGMDRTSLELPQNQIDLINELANINPNIIIVNQAGSPVVMPFLNKVKSVVLSYLSGSMGAEALYELLYGEKDFMGSLAETYPLSLESTPAYHNFAKEPLLTLYKESIFTGYRYYDTFNVPTQFSFGDGLSYNTYTLSNVTCSKKLITDDYSLSVSFHIKNEGKLDSKKTIMVFVGKKNSKELRPVKELKGFKKLSLKSLEEKDDFIELGFESFASFNMEKNQFEVSKGEYTIFVGFSLNEIISETTITIDNKVEEFNLDYDKSYLNFNENTNPSNEAFMSLLHYEIPAIRNPRPFTINSSVREIKTSFLGRLFISIAVKEVKKNMQSGDDIEVLLENSLYDSPIRMIGMNASGISKMKIDGLIDILNHHPIRGLRKLNRK